MTHKEAPVADWVTIPDLYRDPFPIYQRLRAEGGVHWVPSVNRYLVTSYDAVHETELDQRVYSANEQGSLQIRAMGHSMLRRDDPEHYVERKAWQPALRPGVVKRVWTDMFRQTAEHYLAEFIERGSGADLVQHFAAPFAAESLRQICGLYNVKQEDLQRWSQTMIDATGNYADDPEVWRLGKQSYDEVDVALDEMLKWHAKHPDNSLISQLLRLPDYEMPLESIRANLKMTIGGGLNEPRDAIGVASWALLSHPEQLDLVRSDPALWHTVFDETIRWVAPIGMYSRQTTREVSLNGVRLPEGARLGICLLSANRDSTVWDHPEKFDIRREVKPHLAFGKGVHVCLGAWVARAEVADVVLPMLFDRLEGLRLSETDPAEIRGWVFRGLTKLPVEWDRVRSAGRGGGGGGGGAGAGAGAGAGGGSGAGTRASAGGGAGAGPGVGDGAGAVAGANAGGAGAATGSSSIESEAGTQAGRAATAPTAPAPRVAIVGSGPSGCFTAQALRRVFPAAPIEVIDRLPTPYGLVRYGVAADHQGTKTVSRQFDRLFTDEGVTYRGNTHLGDDVTLEELREAYDMVVLATGMHGDARLEIPGGQLARGAGVITRLLNGHPDEGGIDDAAGASENASDAIKADQIDAANGVKAATSVDTTTAIAAAAPDATDAVSTAAAGTNSKSDEPAITTGPAAATAVALGESVVVIGHGNVAMDIARLLARDSAGLQGSDIDDELHQSLTGSVRTIHLVGRSAPALAKFDPVMVRELACLPGVQHVVHGAGDLPADGRDARIDAVRALRAGSSNAKEPRIRIEWWFGLTPARFESAASAEDVENAAGAGSEDRVTRAVFVNAEGEETALGADDVITAVGFTENADSPVRAAAHANGRVEPGLYVAGWLRHGPRGTIPDQRTDARGLAQVIADDVRAGAVQVRRLGLAERAGSVDFDGWRRIDLRERLGAAPGRERVKLRSRASMLEAARDLSLELPEVLATEALAASVPVTILFGTESGGAELVAEELRRMLGDDADAEVRDLAEMTPNDLARDRLNLIVCSTYGDGEVPTPLVPFHAALSDASLALDGVRYAMFGMGDRSYEKTYSRGSELIDEGLTARGAARVGEYGRHDAGGSIAASEAASDWAAGVLAEVAAVAVR